MNIKERLKEHFEEVKKVCPKDLSNTVAVLCAGSQIYKLDTENSDVDSVLIFIPTMKDIVCEKEFYSHTFILENEEHCTVKDIRAFFYELKKSSPNSIDLLIPQDFNFIVNEEVWNKCTSLLEDAIAINPEKHLAALVGAMNSKKKNIIENKKNIHKEIAMFYYWWTRAIYFGMMFITISPGNAEDYKKTVEVNEEDREQFLREKRGETIFNSDKIELENLSSIIKKKSCFNGQNKNSLEKLENTLVDIFKEVLA